MLTGISLMQECYIATLLLPIGFLSLLLLLPLLVAAVLLVFFAVGEDGIVRVEFVYEPPQQASLDQLLLERHTPQEAQVWP
jgi:hypothetical protein